MKGYVIALDQGTTSSRAIVFDRAGQIVSIAQYDYPQIYPRPGWVEHDPADILGTQIRALAEAFEKSGVAAEDIAAIGVTNQRETSLVWDRTTGKPVYNAIVWQCRRTAAFCDRLAAEGVGAYIRDKTGLLIDAYFSGTKIRWILDNVEGARERAERGELIFGTVDSWLIWNLTGGREHISDYSNCSRTMLFDIDRLRWDEDLCRVLGVPMSMLPAPVPNSAEYGRIAPGIKGIEALAGVPICGSAGDQAAALLGQGCIVPGEAKNTYGTGCFTLMNTGERSVRSLSGMLTSVAWSLGGRTTYALEGSVFNAGSSIQWLRDEVGLIATAAESGPIAASVPDNGGVYLVSAFTGLGAPHWDMYARGTMVGLTRGTTRAHIVRAAMEGIAYQVKDLLDAMELDSGRTLSVLQRGRRRLRQRFPHAVPGGYPPQAHRPPAHGRDDRLWRGLSRGPCGGAVEQGRGDRRAPAVRTGFRASDGRARGGKVSWRMAPRGGACQEVGDVKMSESILVVKTGLLAGIISGKNGLIRGRDAEILDIVNEHHEFRPRPEMEEDPSYRQIIPYVVLTRGEEVFVLRRLKKGGEKRLHGLLSIGVGGHINPVDEAGRGEALMRGLRREVEEEVEVERELSLVPVGVINEETNEVGSVHLGFMFRMEVAGEVRVRETEKLEGLWVPKSELPALREQLEGWSKIAMEAIV